MELLQTPIVPQHARLQAKPFLGAAFRPLRSLKHLCFVPAACRNAIIPQILPLPRSSRSLDVTLRLVDNVPSVTAQRYMTKS